MTEDERIDLGWEIGWIYFIQSGQSGSIKIGWAKDPNRRIVQLQTAHPSKLKLLGVISGSLRAEREVHAKFAHGRTRGEWFKRPIVLDGVMSLILDKGFTVAVARKSRTIPEKSARHRYNLIVPSV